MKPNGRDSEVGTGRSESPAALCADTLRPFQISKQETRTCL